MGRTRRITVKTYESVDEFLESLEPRVMDADDIAFLELAAAQIPKSGFTVFDVGAAKGNWTQLALETIGRDGQFYLFEPTSRHFQMLKDRFSDEEIIRLSNCAVGSDDAEVDVIVCANTEWSYVDSDIPDDALTERVPMVRLDSYMQRLRIHEIHFLKIDTEGHEFEVIRGLGSMLESVMFIQVEYGGTWGREERRSGASIYDLLTYVCDAGFRLHMYKPERTFQIQPSNFIADGKMRNILFSRI